MNKILTNSFEGIEQVTKSAAQQVKKAVSDVGQDVTESLGLALAQANDPDAPKELPKSQKQQIKASDQASATTIRNNIAKLNQQIAEARKKKEEKQKEIVQTQTKPSEKQKEKFEKSQKESALLKIIKSRKGTKEGMQRASG
jgi:septal ring factor EnvC (AmiA/AmiB activator)